MALQVHSYLGWRNCPLFWWTAHSLEHWTLRVGSARLFTPPNPDLREQLEHFFGKGKDHLKVLKWHIHVSMMSSYIKTSRARCSAFFIHT